MNTKSVSRIGWQGGLCVIKEILSRKLSAQFSEDEMQPVIIAIAGGTCSGKTYLASELNRILFPTASVIVSMDDYFKDASDSNMPRDDLGRLNFDCPEAYRRDKLLKTVNDLLAGKEAWSPKYDLATNTILGPHGKVLSQAAIIIIEGLFAIDFLKDFEGVFKVYLEIDYRTASNRRLKRDTQKYPEVNPERIYSVFNRRIWPNYLHHVAPQKEKADLIIDEALSRLED